MEFLNKNNSKKESMTNKEFVEAVKYILNHELLSLNDKNNSKENPLILVDKEARLNRYDVICSYIKELEAEKKSIENFFKSEMDGYETAYIGDRKLTFKNQSRSTIDTQKLRIELYELHRRIIETETGYNRETVEKLIQRFIEYKKIYYCEETKEIYLVNWIKHNMSNSPKVQKCIKKEIENIKNKEFVKLLYKSFEELGYNIENGENNHGKYNKEYRESKHAKSLKNENDKTYKSTTNDELEQLRKRLG